MLAPVELRGVEEEQVIESLSAQSGVPTERPVGGQSRRALVRGGGYYHHLLPEGRLEGPERVDLKDRGCQASEFRKVVQKVREAPVTPGRRSPFAGLPVELVH